MDSYSPSEASPINRYEDNVFTSSPRQHPRPLAARSRGHYGSRSMERSLQHPLGFHNPLQSLSPIAARFAMESNKDSVPEEKVNDNPSSLGIFAVRPCEFSSNYDAHDLWITYPHEGMTQLPVPFPKDYSVYKFPAAVASMDRDHELLVQKSRITTDSIAKFWTYTISTLEKLEKQNPYPDAVESAPFPALTLLLNKLREFKHGNGMTGQEIEAMRVVAMRFLETLDWTENASLAFADRTRILVIRENVMEALQLLKAQREQAIADDKEREDARTIGRREPIAIVQMKQHYYPTRVEFTTRIDRRDACDYEYEPSEYHVHGW